MAGLNFRKGITLVDIFKMFPDDATAEQWFIKQRWPDGVECVKCGSTNVNLKDKHPTMSLRCRTCYKRFSVRMGTVMQGSNLGYQVWAVACYLLSTNIKGVSSLKLHRDLGITQKSAWHLAHRIRKTWEHNFVTPFTGPVEADETYIGGKEKNKHAHKRLNVGGGTAGKVAVAGIKDRETGKIRAKVVERTDGATLKGFLKENTAKGTKVYTDESAAYTGLPNHESVNHSVSEYVNGMAHTNGLESFWSLLKRGYHGTYHLMSEKHLNRYVDEFSGRHNVRSMDTIDQLQLMAKRMVGKQLRYTDLTEENQQTETELPF